MPPNNIDLGQKGKPWPRYFLIRTTGQVVPLIAVDELPPGTDLFNIPRSLDLEATIGMINLGLQRSSGSYYEIIQSSKNGSSAPLIGHPKNTASHPKTCAKQTTHPNSPSSTTSSNSPTPPTTPRVPAKSPNHHHSKPNFSNPQNNTTLCRHWCTHGICKWGQQCRYRHIMPMTLHGLQEVGLRDWPAWYRGLNPGYFVDQGRNQNLDRIQGVKGRGGERDGKCASRNCAGGRCCEERGLHGEVRGEKEREGLRGLGNARVGGRERGTGTNKGEELGDQILKRLRGIGREGKGETGEKESNSNAAIERTAVKNVQNWEDDESDEDGMQEREHDLSRGKLVDI